MKKNRSSERPAQDFKNSPFRSLKGFSPKPSKEPASPRKKSEQTEDDSELFFRAVAGTKKLSPGDSPNAKPADTRIVDRAAIDSTRLEQKDRELFLHTMQKVGTVITKIRKSADDEIDRDQPRSASSRMRQLKRGTMRIAGELDLHGFMRDEALRKLELFVSSAYAKGREAVLVITGKGINSPDGPVLQGAVSTWLREQGKRMVAEFVPAPRDLGGSGAFVVFLRKK